MDITRLNTIQYPQCTEPQGAYGTQRDPKISLKRSNGVFNNYVNSVDGQSIFQVYNMDGLFSLLRLFTRGTLVVKKGGHSVHVVIE